MTIYQSNINKAKLYTPLQVFCDHCHKEFWVELPSTYTGLREMEAAGFCCEECESKTVDI
jgi:hypothetical protein